MTSRARLLAAAAALFGEQGYERTTTREIGERAGVDPSLIARYFDSKAGLYVAALHETDDGPPADLLHPGRLAGVLSRLTNGPGPVLSACVRRYDEPAVRLPAQQELQRRLVGPLAERYTADGGDRPQLRAEVAVAAFAGVALSRSAGALETLAAAGVEEVAELVELLLRALTPPAYPGAGVRKGLGPAPT